MKNLLKSFVTATVLLGCTSAAFAQATATSSASANVVTPIAIVKVTDMNFGNAAVSATAAGTILLTPAGTRTAGGGGGVTLPAITGTVSAASFTVSGQATYTYAISLPTSCSLTSSTYSMTANAFTSTPATTGTLSASGTQTLTVGATLTVAAAQHAGAYTSATGVPVTVNYN